MSAPYKVEYQAVWPQYTNESTLEAVAIEATSDKDAFFDEFDRFVAQLEARGCPKHLRPTVEVRALQWSIWNSYGSAQTKGWIQQ